MKILRNETFIMIISIILFFILFAGIFLLIIGFQKSWCDDHNGKYGSDPTGCAMGEIKRTLNKMKELEEDK